MELQDIVADDADMLALEQAKAYRETLMSERTVFVDTVNRERFGHEFNMWYVSSGSVASCSTYESQQ